MGKGARERLIPLDPKTVRAIVRYLLCEVPPFVESCTGTGFRESYYLVFGKEPNMLFGQARGLQVSEGVVRLLDLSLAHHPLVK